MPRRESLSLFKCDRSAFLFNGLRKGQPLAVLVCLPYRSSGKQRSHIPLRYRRWASCSSFLWDRCRLTA